MIRTVRVALVCLGALLVSGPTAEAQIRMRSSDARVLRDAANRESQGDFQGAEEVLRGLLEREPGSSGALFALERVLRAQGEVVEILPVVDRFLESAPTATGVRFLKLRVLAEADSLEELRSQAEAWLDEDPANSAPYSEVARVYERAFGADEALSLLRRGREESGRADALALEIGDLLASMGDTDGAVDEWAAAVGDDAGQAVTVLRRVQGLPSGVPGAGRRLVGTLSDSADLPRRRAAARIALDLGLGNEALEVSRAIEGELVGRTRVTFLSDVARRAREQDLVEVASWAYDALGDEASSPAERRQFDQRLVEVALVSGDTATALEAQRRVAASFSSRSVDRRRATAQVIRLESASASPDRIRTLLAEFQAEYPGAPELDGLAAAVSMSLNARGESAAAAQVLAGVEGPESLLEKGYLYLDEGDIEQGRGALLLAVTGLPPSQATPVIQFASLLGRLSEGAAVHLAAAGVEARRGRPGEAATGLAGAVPELERDEQPLVLAEAARIAAAGGQDDLAAELRTSLIEEYGAAPEAAEASLALARFHARTSRGVPEAIRLLEELITNRPNAAVVPHARLELERLRGRGR